MIDFEHLKAIPQHVHDDALVEYKTFRNQDDHAKCCASVENICIGGFNMACRVAYEAGRLAGRSEIAKEVKKLVENDETKEGPQE